jgi:hypothetical protein
MTVLKLYVRNLLDSINATNARFDPAGLEISPATSAADFVLSGMLLGVTALLLTQ